MLDALETAWAADPAALVGDLLTEPSDGRVKLFVMWRALDLRKKRRALFDDGQYLPLRVSGAKAEHVCAFARKLNGQPRIIVIVPRMACRLMGGEEKLPLGEGVWGDTRVTIPQLAGGSAAADLFSGGRVGLEVEDGHGTLPVSRALNAFPCAFLLLDS